MDWLLKILGVSAKNRAFVKKTAKAVNAMTGASQTRKSTESTSKAKTNSKRIVDIDELDCDTYEIVGESHYQDVLDKIAGPKTAEGVNHKCEVLLICENGNKYDKNAVRVEIGGETVGYLCRDDAKSFREMLVENDVGRPRVRARATVNGGWRREDGEGAYGVVLDLD
jgi:hypothetical protein